MFCYSIDGNINMLCRERPAVCCTKRETKSAVLCYCTRICEGFASLPICIGATTRVSGAARQEDPKN